MPALTRTRTDIEAAWRSFIADGRLAECIRPEIRRSWLRVAHHHIDPAMRACPRALDADDALARPEAEEAFRIASPLVAHFAERLAADGHVIGYFDAGGVMLAIDGNHRTRGELGDVNFAPGACWAEHAAGTNAIGTALIEEQPVEVFASEHFVEAWQHLTCASVPVRLGGRVVGVVDITSPWTAYNPALLLTAEALARAVEARFEADAARRENAILLRVAHDAIRLRDDVLDVASHELKTPLTPLALDIQRLQRLADREGTLDPERLRKALRNADRNLGRLVKFIDDLLEVSSVDREPLHLALEPTDLGAIVRDVIEQHRGAFERQGCDVSVAVAREVVGAWDRGRLKQALQQLVINAAKYAPGPIEVAVEVDGASARVLVRDHGPGIAREDQERIFLPFERTGSFRQATGFGLGLHAVRRIVEAHGGAIRVESAPGAGSTFLVELPLQPAPE